jgi:zinc protease
LPRKIELKSIKNHSDSMKKMMKLGTVLASALLFFSVGAMAQMGPLPVDPAVRTGTLDNGLTYYIRHNELPAGQAEFYIAQKVGSIQEEDNQRGLAHFLEHMAFNGTTNFPDKTLMQYLESVGAKFGYNINAYTGFDQTVYTLMNIPVARQGVVDSALMVIRDWSNGIALHDAEIDAERGVIHEEWRTGQSAQMRIFDQLLPVIFEGSRYGNRLPIGTMEVIDNFSYAELRDYYAKWYRPDLQAVIVVGDVDVDAIEGKIKEMFGPIPAAVDPAERVYFPVPDNTEPIVAFATDRELPYVQTMVMYKHDPLPMELRNTAASFVQSYMSGVMGTMMGSRLEELTNQAEPPFMAAELFDMEILGVSVTKEALTGAVVTDENGVDRGLRALLTEIRRVEQHGFTASEYERAKADFLTNIETTYNERDKQRSNTYANEYVRAFTEFEPIPGIEAEYALYNQIVPMLSVDLVNQYVQELIGEQNIVVMMQGPDREGLVYPSKDEILAIMAETAAVDTEPYVEEVSDEPLVSALPTPGTVTATSHDEIFDATVWTLSNGARVVVKPTTYKDDEIRMTAVSPGGTSLIGSADDIEAIFIDDVAGVGGLGAFSATDLPKVLAGKNATASASVSELSESVTASASPRDLETMMQLVYLTFTDVRADEAAFASWKSRTSAALRNMASEPMYVYADSLSRTMFAGHPRHVQPTAEMVEAVDYARTMELAKERFADASNFTFLFVGNVDPEVLKPLVEQYVASLPSSNGNEKAGSPIPVAKGHVNNYFERTAESPKVTMAYVTTGQVEPTLKNTIEMDAMWQVLFSRYFETLREDEGGTYSPQVHGSLSSDTGWAQLFTMIDTNVELYERLGGIIIAELEKLATEGPSDADYQKIKEYMLKTDIQNRQENSFWMGRMRNFYLNGRDHVTGYAEAVEAMTKEDIRDFARRLIDAGNRVNVTMNAVAAE